MHHIVNFPHEISGWLTELEGRFLAQFAEGKIVLEIGSYCGRSTVCLGQTASHVHAVDTFDGRGTPHQRATYQEFLDNLTRYGVLNKVSIHACESKHLNLKRAIDLAFIDSSHDYNSVKTDIAVALGVLKPDGFLAFHDYRTYPGEHDGRWDPGVTQAVDEMIAMGGTLVSRAGSVALIRPGIAPGEPAK